MLVIRRNGMQSKMNLRIHPKGVTLHQVQSLPKKTINLSIHPKRVSRRQAQSLCHCPRG